MSKKKIQSPPMGALLKISDILIIAPFVILGFWVGNESASSGEITSFPPNLEPLPDAKRRAPELARIETSSQPQGSTRSAYLSSKKSSAELARIMQRLLKGEPSQNWKTELEKIFELEGRVKGDGALALLVLFSRWAETDFQEAFDCARKLTVNSHLYISEIFSQLAAKDVEKALVFFENIRERLEPHEAHFLVDVISDNWAKSDPKAALEWGLAQDEGLMLLSCMRITGYTSEKTREYIDHIYSSKGYVPNQIITEWAAKDPAAVLEWRNLMEKNNPYYQGPILEGVALHSIDQAKEIWRTLPANEQSEYASIIAKHIADPREALDWIIEVKPPTEINEPSLSRIYRWSFEFPNEAENWLQNLSASSTRDIAVKLYVQSVSDARPYETVMRLVDCVQEPALKEDILKIARQRWRK